VGFAASFSAVDNAGYPTFAQTRTVASIAGNAAGAGGVARLPAMNKPWFTDKRPSQ